MHRTSDFLAARHPYLPEAHEKVFSPDVIPDEVALAFGRRGVGKLADVLRSQETSVGDKCAALQLLIDEMGTQEKKMEAIRNGVVEAATALLTAKDAALRANAAIVVSRIGLVMQGRSAIKSAATIPCLVALCGAAEPEVRSGGNHALACVTYFRDGWDAVVSTRGAVDGIVGCLDRNPEAVEVFVNLTAFYSSGSEQSLRSGVMPHLVRIISDPPSTKTLDQACTTVRHLAVHEMGKTEAVRCNAVAALAGHLEHPSASVRTNVTGAFASMCISLESKKQFHACGPAAVEQLARLLNDPTSEDIQTNAHVAIVNLAELPALRSAFVAALVVDLDLYMKVFGPAGCEPLCGLLIDEDPKIRAAAVAATEAISAKPEGAEALIQTLHIVPRLVGVFGNEASEGDAVKAAARTLTVLCQTYKDAKRRFADILSGDSEDLASIRSRLVAHAALAGLLVA